MVGYLLYSTVQHIDGQVDVGINLGIDRRDCCARRSCRAREVGSREQGHTGLTLMPLVGTGKPLRQHEIAVGADGMGLALDVVHLTG